MDGILLVNKPKGVSSYDVIRRIKFLYRQAGLPPPKLGHAGTLDPLAEGLLIVLVGKATKQQARFMNLDKEYIAQITLGINSATDDAEGPLTRIKNQGARSKVPAHNEALKTLKKFEGEIMQLPPQFSALKVGGERAYRAARQGRVLPLKPRPIKIYQIELLGYKYPHLEIKALVSSGTYIRALARDIGLALQTGAYLSGLKRSQIGGFNLNAALELDDLSIDIIQNLLKDGGN